jgi:cytochrome c biogenesis protein CcmG/thiol:disulfide interchange protein DsbE
MKLSPKHTIVTLALLSFCLVVIITLGKGLNLNPNSTGNALQDKPAKDFNIEIVQGSKTVDVSSRSSFTLDQFRGKPLVLNFWASWCVSCRTEAHELEKFWRKYQGQGVQVVGIAVHDSQETSKAFIAQYGKTYAIGLDLDGKAGINYGVTGVPETFFIDRNGIIKHKEAGPVDMAILEKHLPAISMQTQK